MITRIDVIGRPTGSTDVSKWQTIETQIRPSSLADFQAFTATDLAYASGATTTGPIFVGESTTHVKGNLSHAGTAKANLYAEGNVTVTGTLANGAQKYDQNTNPTALCKLNNCAAVPFSNSRRRSRTCKAPRAPAASRWPRPTTRTPLSAARATPSTRGSSSSSRTARCSSPPARSTPRAAAPRRSRRLRRHERAGARLRHSGDEDGAEQRRDLFGGRRPHLRRRQGQGDRRDRRRRHLLRPQHLQPRTASTCSASRRRDRSSSPCTRPAPATTSPSTLRCSRSAVRSSRIPTPTTARRPARSTSTGRRRCTG